LPSETLGTNVLKPGPVIGPIKAPGHWSNQWLLEQGCFTSHLLSF